MVGDYLCARYGLLEATPLTIEIKGNRIVDCESDNRELRDEFWAYTHTDENSDRVGEFAIGTNLGIEHVIGNILQDEKFPGHSHCIWQSLWRAHRRALDFDDAYRCGGPAVQYLGG